MSTDIVPRTPITIEDLLTACAAVLAETDPTTEAEDGTQATCNQTDVTVWLDGSGATNATT